MRDETIGKYLDDLADRIPAPGGGAVAALHAAQAAGLVAMVARYTTGEKYTEHSEVVERILLRAEELRGEASELAEQDAAAFGAVADAYRLPRSTDDERAARSAAIAGSLLAAARPPAAVIVVADYLVALTQDLLPIGNRNVISDVAAAAEAARAAAATARVNVEVNLGGVRDETERRCLQAVIDSVPAILDRADAVALAVRGVINR